MEQYPRPERPDIIPDFYVRVENSFARVNDPAEILAMNSGEQITLLQEEFIGQPVSSTAITARRSTRDEATSYHARIRLNPNIYDQFDGKYKILDRLCPVNSYNFVDVDGLCFERIGGTDSVLVTAESGAEFIVQHAETQHGGEIIVSNKHWVISEDGSQTHKVEPVGGYDPSGKTLLEEFLKTYMFVMSATPDSAYLGKIRPQFPPERYFIEPKTEASKHLEGEPVIDSTLVLDARSFSNMMRTALKYRVGDFDQGDAISTLPGMSNATIEGLYMLYHKYFLGPEESDSRPRGVVLAGPDAKRSKEVAAAFATSIDADFMSLMGSDLYDRTETRTSKKVNELLDEAVEEDGRLVLFIENLPDIFKKLRNKNRAVAGLGAGIARATTEKPDLVIFASCNDLQEIPAELWALNMLNWQLEIDLPTGIERRQIVVAHLASLMLEDAVNGQPKFISLASRLNLNKIALKSNGLSASDIREVIDRTRERRYQERRRTRGVAERPVTTEDITGQITKYKN